MSEYKLFLKQTAKLEERIATAHATLGELSPAEAEAAFLARSAGLDTYGYDPYTVKDPKGQQLYVGVTHRGILVYQSNRKIHHIKWDDLEKVPTSHLPLPIPTFHPQPTPGGLHREGVHRDAQARLHRRPRLRRRRLRRQQRLQLSHGPSFHPPLGFRSHSPQWNLLTLCELSRHGIPLPLPIAH